MSICVDIYNILYYILYMYIYMYICMYVSVYYGNLVIMMVTTNYTFSLSKIFRLLPSSVASIILSQSAKISKKQDGRSVYVIMKTMCSSGYQHKFMVTHALGHIMHSYTLPVPVNQRVLSKLSKEHSIASGRIEHYVCRGSLITTCIMLLTLLVEHSLVYWYQ